MNLDTNLNGLKTPLDILDRTITSYDDIYQDWSYIRNEKICGVTIAELLSEADELLPNNTGFFMSDDGGMISPEATLEAYVRCIAANCVLALAAGKFANTLRKQIATTGIPKLQLDHTEVKLTGAASDYGMIALCVNFWIMTPLDKMLKLCLNVFSPEKKFICRLMPGSYKVVSMEQALELPLTWNLFSNNYGCSEICISIKDPVLGSKLKSLVNTQLASELETNLF